ncbi:MAG: hypothetical protein GYB66_04045 [Chloroflexi bacterium]|nr:hypothetical protein [Chloroflexota bacterium]
MWRDVCYRLIIALLVLFMVSGESTQRPTQAQQASPPRLQYLTELGGPIRAVEIDGVDAVLAEGESIVRVPLLGTSAYQATQRLTLRYGPVLDLKQTEQALYAVTASHLVVVSRPAGSIRAAIRGGGERIDLWQNMLAVSSREHGVRLFAIQSEGDLRSLGTVATPSEVHQTVFTSRGLLAVPDRSTGLRLVVPGEQHQVQGVLSEIGGSTTIASFDQWVFVSAEQQLYSVDASGQQGLRLAGVYSPAQTPQDFARWGKHLAIADGDNGLKLYTIDRSTGELKYENARVVLPANTVAISPDGQYLLVAELQGIRIYDATRFPAWDVVGFVPLWEPARRIRFIGDGLALLALGNGGLAVLDVASGNILATVPFAGPVRDAIAHPVYPTVLYVLLGDGRLVTLGFGPSYTSTPNVYSDLPLPGQPGRLSVDEIGGYLAVASGRAGLQVFALGYHPTEPLPVAIHPAHDLNTPGITHVDYLDDSRWTVLDSGQLRLLHIDNRSVRQVDTFPTQSNALTATSLDLVLVGEPGKISAFTTDGHRLSFSAAYVNPGSFQDAYAALGQLMLATETGELILLDVSDPTLPKEQRAIPVPFAVHRIAVEGDDLLLVSPNEGMLHMRFPLLSADQAQSEPMIVGHYRPAQQIRWMLPLADGSIGLAGDGWYQWHVGQAGPVLLGDRAPIAGVGIGEGTILLGSDYRLYHLDPHGNVTEGNASLYGVSVAADQETVWLLTPDGRLITVAIETMQPVGMERILPPESAPTLLIAYRGTLLIGTRRGEVWRIPNDLSQPAATFASNLGGPVTDIQVMPSGELLVSAGEGGLWWIQGDDVESLGIAAHAGNHAAMATAVDPEGDWIAVATGACGLRVIDLAAWRADPAHTEAFAIWTDSPVSDVHFLDAHRLIALVNDRAVLFRLNPDGDPDHPPVPYRHASQSVTGSSLERLEWDVDAPDCLDLRYEVWIEDELVGITHQKFWPLDMKSAHDLKWQIVVLDETGARTSGPIWYTLGAPDGWVASPQDVGAAVMPPSSSSDDSSLWLAFGMVLLGLGIMGIIAVLWRYVAVSSLLQR